MTQDPTTVRHRLEAELREAEQELQELELQLEHTKPEFGLGTGSTGFDEWEVNMLRRDTVMARIEALRSALARLEEDQFGRCERCGAKIDPERLEILPTTTLCAECARKARSEAALPGAARSRVGPRR
ncbi:MAG: TraR/DksA C4-type zinc finger protein [Caldilineales bacterium]|nr:TraR/DksA C4-type zinc finger protein [Caldilineales bacterium]MDW8317718.1 TraR/DksA C4-type zinc finger protein [Anaerolineae bacterium]